MECLIFRLSQLECYCGYSIITRIDQNKTIEPKVINKVQYLANIE